jgi:amino acid permease
MRIHQVIAGLVFLAIFFLVIFIDFLQFAMETNSNFKILIFLLVFLEFYLIYRMRKRSGGELETNNNDDSANSEPEKINFSEIPHSTEGQAPKPIDKSGNVFLHNEETLTEDMANIGIDRYNDIDKDKEEK